MKNSLLYTAVLCIVSLSFIVNARIKFSGDIGIQGVRYLGDLHGGHNFDALWGRANLKAGFKADNFSSLIHLRVYPAGYGGIEFLTGDVATAKSATASKLQVIQAWAMYGHKIGSVKVGRGVQKFTNGMFFGDYIQRGSGGSFCYPGALHNALQFRFKTGVLTSLIHFGAKDANLDRGDLLICETITPTEMLAFCIGYKANVFDKIQYGDDDIVNHFNITGSVIYAKKQKIYTEVGIRNIGSDDDVSIPLNFGITVPAGKVLDLLAAEIEYAKERSDTDKNAFLFAFIIARNFGKYCNIKTALHSNGGGTEVGDLGWSMRFTAAFK